MKEKKFDIFGTTYTIKYVDNLSTEDHLIYGQTIDETKEILIANTIGTHVVSKEEQKIVLLHELFHAILDSGQYCELSQRENLVEWLARSINTLLEQKVI